MQFVISGRLPNLNDYTKACRANKFAGASMKKKAEATILSALEAQDIQATFGEQPVKVSIVWYEPNARRDFDNVVFSKKFILDALVKYGVLTNDSLKYVRKCEDEVLIDKDNPRIEVNVEYFDKYLPF